MKNIRVGFTILFCFLLLISVKAEKIWNVDNVPIPYLTNSTQYVSDPDHYLDEQSLDSANYYLALLEKECKVQSVFVVVGRVDNADAFRMAQDLGNKYGVGSKKTRRGLVVVISVEDHKSFIAPGMGLEGELTDVDCDDIGRACIVTNMKEGNVAAAVTTTCKAIYNKVKKGTTGVKEIDEGSMSDEDSIFVIIFLLIVIFGMPGYYLIRYILEELGIVKKPKPKPNNNRRRRNDDDWFPPFFLGGGGGGFSSGSGFSGGSFGGGSFGGGGAGNSW